MPHAATAFWHHFHPWITKTMDLETVSHFGRKSQTCAQSGFQEAPKCIINSMKINILASVCPLGVPLDPRITKMLSRAPKKEPQGLQNERSWSNN